ncbi:phenolic acid decarboxylase [Klebsiella pneumoniae]|uniref:Phenolic acid decarboxylase n=1 Tax=Klebsiella pneumoniae TaxID=573 RepID=A0A377ZZF6_KLEPN|nr:phenolic acid decarboxylase [Klebsiella pneumoniae]
MNNPEKTICFQNDHIPLMNSYRDAGPAYPTEVMTSSPLSPSFATVARIMTRSLIARRANCLRIFLQICNSAEITL